MRVLSVLSLLCLCVLGVSGQYVVDVSSSQGNGWVLTGVGSNPVLNFTAGNTYNFTISAVLANHPFAFSSLENANTNTITAIDTTVYTVSTSGTGCGGSATGGFTSTAAGCVVNIAIAANATNATLWYKCTIHPGMTAKINVWAAAPAGGNTTGNATVAPSTAGSTNSSGNATTVAPTTAAPTTVSPTTSTPTTAPVTGGTIVSNAFHITGNQLTSGYIFTHNGLQYLNPTLNVTAGLDVTISLEWANSKFHPFGLSMNPTTNLTGAQLATTDIFSPDVAKLYQITTPAFCNTTYFPGVPTAFQNSTVPTDFCVIKVAAANVIVGPVNIYYRCARHPLMIGQINVVAAAPNTGGSSTGGSTGGSSSTVAPTQKPSSTGGNSASTITLSGLTMVFALIVAMLA